MITTTCVSKSNRFAGVKCLICDDLIEKGSVQEFYWVEEITTNELKYVGMSKAFWYNRPTQEHNSDYNSNISKYPENYRIYRFKCSTAATLEAATLFLLRRYKSTNTWNRSLNNGHMFCDKDVRLVIELFKRYNIHIS